MNSYRYNRDYMSLVKKVAAILMVLRHCLAYSLDNIYMFVYIYIYIYILHITILLYYILLCRWKLRYNHQYLQKAYSNDVILKLEFTTLISKRFNLFSIFLEKAQSTYLRLHTYTDVCHKLLLKISKVHQITPGIPPYPL